MEYWLPPINNNICDSCSRYNENGPKSTKVGDSWKTGHSVANLLNASGWAGFSKRALGSMHVVLRTYALITYVSTGSEEFCNGTKVKTSQKFL